VKEPFDLGRFITAQERTYPVALAEIKRGRKRTHWMWFIFPQIAGLGRSGMAQRFAITSVEEARAYLAHPILGKRLVECIEALQGLPESSADLVFGELDAMKLRSSLTLFSQASGGKIFAAALGRWFGGADAATLEILGEFRAPEAPSDESA